MNETYYSLRDVAAILGTTPYKIVYQLTVHRITEPSRLGGRRAFTMDDIEKLATAMKLTVARKPARRKP